MEPCFAEGDALGLAEREGIQVHLKAVGGPLVRLFLALHLSGLEINDHPLPFPDIYPVPAADELDFFLSPLEFLFQEGGGEAGLNLAAKEAAKSLPAGLFPQFLVFPTQEALVDPKSLIFFQDLLFPGFLPGPSFLQERMDGAVQNPAKHEGGMRRDRHPPAMPELILERTGQVVLALKVAQGQEG